jgi:hypothetical protein
MSATHRYAIGHWDHPCAGGQADCVIVLDLLHRRVVAIEVRVSDPAQFLRYAPASHALEVDLTESLEDTGHEVFDTPAGFGLELVADYRERLAQMTGRF